MTGPTGNRYALEIDGNHYPTEDAVRAVTNWPWEDMAALFAALADIWPYYGRFEQREDGTWEIATGGWSGCEDLVGALMDNTMVRAIAWQLSKRGGYFEFKVPDNLARASDSLSPRTSRT